MTYYFSIVTITYNHLTGLKHTAASLAGQSCDDYEWIVIDGGSPDGTRDYLQTTKALWTSEPDSGIYDAMNKGLAKTSGEYILFLNAGDVLADPFVLETIKDTATELSTRPDFIYGDALEQTGPNSTDLAYKAAQPYTEIKNGMFTHHQAMFYKRAHIDQERYSLQYPIAGDYEFTARTLGNTNKVLYCPLPVCIFERGGISQTHMKQGRQEQYRIRKAMGVPTPANILTYMRQSLTATVKKFAPGLYWRIRGR